MQLGEFLAKYIEGALAADQETMLLAMPPAEQLDAKKVGWGHVGYPMIMACAAGIEMLGILTSTYGLRESGKNFTHYWKTYLYPQALFPARAAVADAIYVLARCGITHNFASKAPEIRKGGNHHLVSDGGTFVINCAQLVEDFEASYRDRIAPIVAGRPTGAVSADTMSKRLLLLLEKSRTEYEANRAAIDALGGVSMVPGSALAVPSTASLGGVPIIGPTVASSKGPG